jgi:CHASE2 domain-containing sensor protein
MRSYQAWFHTPRWLMGAFSVAALVELLLSLGSGGRIPLRRRREAFLLAGAALAMLLGSAATSEFVVRYLIPVVPLLVCGGAAAIADLTAAAHRALARFETFAARGPAATTRPI